MNVAIVGLKANGSISLRLPTQMTQNNLDELRAELRLDGADPVNAHALEAVIRRYQSAKGYVDPSDWLDRMLGMLADFCINATNIGGDVIAFEIPGKGRV